MKLAHHFFGLLAVRVKIELHSFVELLLVVKIALCADPAKSLVTALRFGLVIVSSGHSRLWSNPDVLCYEVISREIVHEVFSSDEASVFVILFHDDLL